MFLEVDFHLTAYKASDHDALYVWPVEKRNMPSIYLP